MLLTLAYFGFKNLLAIVEFCEVDVSVKMPIHAYAVTGDRQSGWTIDNSDGTTYKIPSAEVQSLLKFAMRVTWINWELSGSDTLYDYGCHTAPAGHQGTKIQKSSHIQSVSEDDIF